VSTHAAAPGRTGVPPASSLVPSPAHSSSRCRRHRRRAKPWRRRGGGVSPIDGLGRPRGSLATVRGSVRNDHSGTGDADRRRPAFPGDLFCTKRLWVEAASPIWALWAWTWLAASWRHRRWFVGDRPGWSNGMRTTGAMARVWWW
jgi:hypothetical protein